MNNNYWCNRVCPICGNDYYNDKGNLCVCYNCQNTLNIVLSKKEAVSQDFLYKALTYILYHNPQKMPYFFGSDNEYNEIKQLDRDIIQILPEQVESWYPRTFAQKIDYILLYFAEHMGYDGDSRFYSLAEFGNIFFSKKNIDTHDEVTELKVQAVYILEYLAKEGYIEPKDNKKDYFASQFVQMSDYEVITLTPKALARVDVLQKTLKDTKQVFIAMSFDKSLDKANEAIQRAISDNGYIPRRMDEYAHNNQIVPEMLYQIRQSKFVVADLTGHNNGAYYEAGYASGIGKEVILTCKHDSFASDSHFDVKQQATVIWENEDDLKNKLTTWIEATIGKAN